MTAQAIVLPLLHSPYPSVVVSYSPVVALYPGQVMAADTEENISTPIKNPTTPPMKPMMYAPVIIG